MFMTAGDLGLSEYGPLGVVAGSLLVLFIWFVRAARADLRDSRTEFVDYLKNEGQKSTETLVAVANALQSAMRSQEDHDERAQKRHTDVLHRIEEFEQRLKHG